MKEPLLSNSTQNDEIGKMERAINEGFAESEKDLKDKKTPLDQPTQNDWVGRFDKKFSNGGKGSQWGGYWEDIDMFISTVKIEDVKDFIRKELADARREVEVKCDECRNNPCYKCLDLKYGKWRNPVNKNDPAWIHTREATLREEES